MTDLNFSEIQADLLLKLVNEILALPATNIEKAEAIANLGSVIFDLNSLREKE